MLGAVRGGPLLKAEGGGRITLVSWKSGLRIQQRDPGRDKGGGGEVHFLPVFRKGIIFSPSHGKRGRSRGIKNEDAERKTAC